MTWQYIVFLILLASINFWRIFIRPEQKKRRYLAPLRKRIAEIETREKGNI